MFLFPGFSRIAAKTNYILSGKDEMTFDKIRTAAGQLGWTIRTEQIDKAVDFLD